MRATRLLYGALAVLLASGCSGSSADETVVPEPLGVVNVAEGETVRIGEWDITVLSVDRDATAEVMALDDYNVDLAPGEQFVTVAISASFRGENQAGPTSLWRSTHIYGELPGGELVEADGAGECPNPPDELRILTDVFGGGTLTGNVCFVAKTDEIENIALVIDDRQNPDSIARFVLPAEGMVFSAPAVAASEPVGDTLGTRGNPYPLGSVVRVGAWDVTVTGFNPDLTQIITDEDRGVGPVTAGRQEAGIYVTMTNTGSEATSVFGTLMVRAVADSTAVSYGDGVYHCRLSETQLEQYSNVEPGASLSGHICWELLPEESGSMVLYLEPTLTVEDDRVYFATH